MTRYLFTFLAAAAATACGDSSREPRTADEPASESTLNRTHREVKEELRKAADRTGSAVDSAHEDFKEGARRVADDLGVRCGSPGGPADGGSAR